MGRRSSMARRPMDAYDTPAVAVLPLLAHLPGRGLFCEPCAGRGDLIAAIAEASGGRCLCPSAWDSAPRAPDTARRDALRLGRADLLGASRIITNPPWTRALLHPLIVHLSALAPTWLLFDAEWLHTRQAVPMLPLLRCVVSVGRLRWIPGSAHTSKDSCAWYLFDAATAGQGTAFHGRAAA